MYCKNCGAEIIDATGSCAKCLTPIGLGNSYCSGCGTQIPNGVDACPSCSMPITPPEQQTNNQPPQGYQQPPQGYQQPPQGYQQPPQGYQQPPQGYQQPPQGYQQPPQGYQQPQGYQPPNNNQYQGTYPYKSKMAAGLLGIFLGSLGIHNFYLGFTSKAVIQIVVTIFTCGLGGLWGFIEGILILCGSTITADANGMPFTE